MKEKVVDRVGIGGVEYRFFRIISNTRSVWDGRVGKVGKGSWSVEFNNSVSDYFGCKRFRDRVIRYIRTSIGYSKQVYIYIYIYI